MTTLYILCGFPFAGKTTLAKKLEKHYGFVRISPDDIRLELGFKDQPTDQQWQEIFEESYKRIDTVLSQGKSVISDSLNFKKEERNLLREIAKNNHAETKVILVKTEVNEARKRWEENKKTMNRSDVPSEDFNLVVNNFDIPTPEEQLMNPTEL